MMLGNKLLDAKNKIDADRPKVMTATEPIIPVAVALKTEDPPVTNQTRKDWNDYLNYLDKKGIKGNPSLDKGGLGYQVFDSYVKQNPQTSLSRATLPVIRKEMLNYRQWVLDQAKQGKAVLTQGTTPDNFMKHVVDNETTKDPNLPGSQLTSTKFPDSYLQTFNNGKLVDVKNQGFVKRDK